MSDYRYRRKSGRWIFVPESEGPYKISRTKIEDFSRCPRCFYLDQRLGIGRPSLPAFALNVAVDALMKKEFDTHRAKGSQHPLMKHYGIDAVPFPHKDIEVWRNNRQGIQFVHEKTNLLITGAVDDVWVNPKGELIIVDYKATSKAGSINLDEGWGPSYKKQIEVYQWLFRKNGFPVARTGYFVYCNGDKDKKAFDGKLEFNVEIIPHEGNDSWVEPAIIELKKCLLGELPPLSENCEYCMYRKEASSEENKKSARRASQRSLF